MNPKPRQVEPSVRSGPGEGQPSLGLGHSKWAAMRWRQFAETKRSTQSTVVTKAAGHCTDTGEASLYARANDPVDFARKVAELIADPARGEEMGRLGRARVLERLSWEHSVPALLAAYERVFWDRA